MIEVFSTNVSNRRQARKAMSAISAELRCNCNFDLDDQDNILRVASDRTFEPQGVVRIMERMGFHASILSDEVPPSLTDLLTGESENNHIADNIR